MDWTSEQSWSCRASGCSAKVTPVFFSYACNADSKRAWKRDDPVWSPISQPGKKCDRKKSSRFAVSV
jgi:hypothetical protein